MTVAATISRAGAMSRVSKDLRDAIGAVVLDFCFRERLLAMRALRYYGGGSNKFPPARNLTHAHVQRSLAMKSMRTMWLAVISLLILCCAGPADELAEKVMKANGAQNWPKVSRVKFTWTLDKGDGKPIARTHDWDIRKLTDTVTVDGKTMTCKVTGPNDTPESKEAFKAWTNDAYWLIAPMKIMDAGVNRTVMPDEQIDGKTCHVLHLS